jgi:hypothetical protein
MVIKKFTYADKVILAPLKCGTRWLSKYTDPTYVDPIVFLEINKEEFGNNTTLVYRDVREHFYSAFYTEHLFFNYEPLNEETKRLRQYMDKRFTRKNKHKDMLFSRFIAKEVGSHWMPNYYEVMYGIFKEYKFNIVHLKNLSSLFKLDLPYDKDEFNYVKAYEGHPSKQEIIDSLTDEQNKILDSIIEKEQMYLHKIINKVI